MGDVSKFFQLPPLILFTLMALVLVGVHGRARDNIKQLWTVAFGFIALEGFARILYGIDLPRPLHLLAHVVALDAYVGAGIVFLLSSSAPRSMGRRRMLYIVGSAFPAVLLATVYAAGNQSQGVLLAIAAFGLLLGPVLGFFQRDRFQWMLVPLLLWMPIFGALAFLNDARQAVYTALALLYALNGVAFLRGLKSTVAGRFVVVLGFLLWGGCFLVHATVVRHHPSWTPMLDDIWDIQKFMVMFGLLVVSLSEQKQRAEHDSLHDDLTGLANRRLFEDRLAQTLSKSTREQTRVILFNMDLDDFKRVNDTLGHAAGDDLLRSVASRLRLATRRSDTLARIGGDEFHLIASGFARNPELDESQERKHLSLQAQRIAAKLCQAIQAPVVIAASTSALYPSMSVGFAIFPLDATSQEDLCAHADVAMYEEKRGRRIEDVGVHTAAPA